MEEAPAAEVSTKLAKLLRINQTVASTLDISEVLKRSLELERDVVDAETGSILLLDSTGEYLEFAVALGDAENILKNHRVRVGEGISGYVAKHKTPLLIADVQKDKRFNAYFDSKTGFQTHSVLCVPIQSVDRLIGVAQAINRAGGGSFTEEDLVLFSVFAGTLGVAIENARLHKHLLDQEKIRQEITAARQVQESYLPRAFPEVPGCEFAGRLEPARQVSGDFFDAFKIRGGRVAILIGDVSGKGLPAALHMCRLLTEVRAGLKHGQTAAGALASVNRLLCEQSARGMFVTMILFLLDAAGGKLVVANAGHLPFYLRKEGRWEEISLDKNPPLGILADRKFTTHVIDLPAGFQVMAYTDGLSEARNPQGEMFGPSRLKDTLDRTRLSPRLLCDKLYLDIGRFTADAEPLDDTTLVTFGSGSADGGLTFEMPSHPSCLSIVRGAAGRVLSGAADSKVVSEVQVALSEAISNVIRHTYKNEHTRKIEIEMSLRGGEFEAIVEDFGPKVDPEKLKGRELKDVKPGGLGIHFMKMVFQTVEYEATFSAGNRLILRKRLP